MPQHIIFFIHGMGEHDGTWHAAGLNQLKAAFKEYEFPKTMIFDDLFLCVPVVYNDILQRTRESANTDYTRFKLAVLAGINPAEIAARTVEKELDKYASLIGAGNNNFIWTHILDVILYRWSNAIRMGIDVSVAEQITRVTSQNEHRTWSIMAHSLGTSVAHNTINSLHNTGFPNAPNGPILPLNPMKSRCNTLAMISNVSRVLQRDDAKVYETQVMPGSSSAGRLCSYYLNARHKLDPLTMPKPFGPDLWPDSATFSTDRYQHIRPSHLHFEADQLPHAHDFDHYLSNPRVHVPFFRSILGTNIVPEEEFKLAKARFDSEIRSNTLDKARKALESRMSTPTGNWKNLLSAIKRLYS
jgi:hypothetical protein